MLADAAALAVLAGAPRAVMLADAGAPAVRAPAPVAVMLADAGASAVLHLLLSPARPHRRPAAPPCCRQPVPRQEERG
jgi:hypothetical protein